MIEPFEFLPHGFDVGIEKAHHVERDNGDFLLTVGEHDGSSIKRIGDASRLAIVAKASHIHGLSPHRGSDVRFAEADLKFGGVEIGIRHEEQQWHNESAKERIGVHRLLRFRGKNPGELVETCLSLWPLNGFGQDTFSQFFMYSILLRNRFRIGAVVEDLDRDPAIIM